MRLSFFKSLIKKYSNSIIALAHTLNDNIETFFIKLIRGSNIQGLSCIKKFDGVFFRPLLKIKKSEILKFLNENKIDYISDPSNFDDRFLRCRIRNYLMPILDKIDTRFEKSVEKTILRMSEAKEIIDKVVLSSIDASGKSVDIERFLTLSDPIKKSILSKMIYNISNDSSRITESIINEIIRFIKNKKANAHQLNNFNVFKKRGIFYLS
jgi:tRNA(Ile)-lysidine synthase